MDVRLLKGGGALRPLAWGMALVAALSACSTPGRLLPSTMTPASKNRVLESREAELEVEEARRLVEAGSYSQAAPRLIQTIAKYPRAKASIEARYWLGVTYYEIKNLHDAKTFFKDYLGLAPEGRYAEGAREYLAKVDKEYREKFPSPEELDAQIETIIEAVNAEPDAPALKMKLADLLWKRGDYESAGRVYMSLIRNDRAYASNEVIQRRVELLPNGGYILLTPAEISRRAQADRPLLIYNLNDFRSGRDQYTRESTYYVVTGQVVNQSESTLYGVQIHVTIYGLGNVVFDTQTITLGRLFPDERRAFSVRFSNFDNIENVLRYEVEGFFER